MRDIQARSGSRGEGGSSSQPHERPGFPLIIYTSRTHSQLKQVIRELKASNYRPKMSVLGSREQMCIHDQVRLFRGRAQTTACQYVCKKRRCNHYSRVSGYMKNHNELANEPFDIEDLVNLGRRPEGPCPYYVSRELHKVVDILFAPYNYLIDPGNRRSLSDIKWDNTILIFDEAHNLEGICADAASFDLPSGYLSTCVSEAQQCIDLCIARREVESSTDNKYEPEHYAILKALLRKLEKRLADVVIESKELGFTRPGRYIFEFLSDLNITYETANMLITTIENAALLLEEGDPAENRGQAKPKGTVCRLESIKDILTIVFKDGGEDHAKFYYFHVQESRSNAMIPLQGMFSRTLSWWCFNPGVAMQEFTKLGVRSIILTSGTLSPLDSFALELNLEFPVRLENPHVISPNQVWVGVIPSGPSGHSLNSSYRNRDSLEYKQGLGNSIVNFARIVPDGLLVFFPSYYLMDQCIECWKNTSHASSRESSTIWDRICKNKQPVVEPKQTTLFPQAIEDYEAKLRDKAASGAIFFAVCRGKVSEGLDFADQAGRAVVITGMPFSMKTDPKVRLKREYLDKLFFSCQNDSKVLSGERWYVQQAARAVNQAVGRVIRHRYDYGSIIFLDERFAQQNHQQQMSYWLRPYIKCYPKFGEAVFSLTKFFRDKGTWCPLKPKIEKSPIVEKREKTLDKLLLSDDLTCLIPNAETFPIKPSFSHLDSRGNTNALLGKIVPANRSNLSNKQKYPLTTQHSRDKLLFQNILKANESSSKKDARYQDTEVVDLDNDTPYFEQLRTEKCMTSCSAKKPKMLESVSNAANHGCSDSLERLYDADSRELPRKSAISSSFVTCCKQSLQLSSCGPAEVGSSNNATTQQATVGLSRISKLDVSAEKTSSEQKSREKVDAQSSSLPHGDKETKGTVFLTQVREKLSNAEYKEFVSLMTALKSKEMNVTLVLESIAGLFSAPERIFLLKRFKDFVPAKYHSIYEQHLASQDAVDDTGCKNGNPHRDV